MGGWNLAQRVVGVVALGAVLWLVGAYLTAPVPFTGWVAYAPLSSGPLRSQLVVARDGLVPLGNLFVWLGLVLAWLAGSLFVLRSGRRRSSSGGAD